MVTMNGSGMSTRLGKALQTITTATATVKFITENSPSIDEEKLLRSSEYLTMPLFNAPAERLSVAKTLKTCTQEL